MRLCHILLATALLHVACGKETKPAPVAARAPGVAAPAATAARWLDEFLAYPAPNARSFSLDGTDDRHLDVNPAHEAGLPGCGEQPAATDQTVIIVSRAMR